MASKLTGATYAMVEPRSIPRIQDKAVWLVQCSDQRRLSKARHANRIWKDEEGIIHIESSILGDTLQWVEDDYGEEGLAKMEAMELRNKDDVMKTLRGVYPRVAKRLDAYKKTASEYSNTYGIDVRLVWEGEDQFVLFLAAKISVTRAGEHGDVQAIKTGVGVMKAAVQEIDDYEVDRGF